MFKVLNHLLRDLSSNIGVSEKYTNLFSEGITFLALIIFSILVYALVNLILKKTLFLYIKKSTSKIDDIIVENKLILRICYLIPVYLIDANAKSVLISFPKFYNLIHSVLEAGEIFVFMLIVTAIISVGTAIYNTFDISKSRPLKGFAQVLKIIVYAIGVLAIIAMFQGKDLGSVFLGLGALSAVAMLVFKDPILGFVGGIQLSINDMVHIGDWIVMDKHGADGNVIDISLTTVKVQNWDQTITTIPTYSMVSESFINWRGMSESGGRRIKRHINIDMESVVFCTSEMLDRFKKYQLIHDYIVEKEDTIAIYNKKHDIDTSNLINGRHQTNLGVFRAYLRRYLYANPNINSNMTMIVRHLQPTEKGLPLEVYVFSANKDWEAYEDIQSDIFDHIVAAVPMFDLRIFQVPTGNTFSKLVNRN
ncbi:MAG: mechanosensitive ion channel family protein [Lentimicrobiaceae bacterium]|jgi:miniconductance mechanosensitive channel|nr:mechanosensitive ion channel family protein [Lentimicrobiaceae bacterium]